MYVESFESSCSRLTRFQLLLPQKGEGMRHRAFCDRKCSNQLTSSNTGTDLYSLEPEQRIAPIGISISSFEPSQPSYTICFTFGMCIYLFLALARLLYYFIVDSVRKLRPLGN